MVEMLGNDLRVTETAGYNPSLNFFNLKIADGIAKSWRTHE
jgi:hypothetical protein